MTPEEIALQSIYLSYILRGVAILVGALFVWRGARMLEKNRPDVNSGEVAGAWGTLKITLRNAPVGTILTILGTVVIIVTLLRGGFSIDSENPDGSRFSFDESPAEMLGPDEFIIVDIDSLASLPASGSILTTDGGVEAFLGGDSTRVIDGRFVDAWNLQLSQGESVTIDFISDDFDPFLILTGEGLSEPITDDDSGEDYNSQISFQAPDTGLYRVIATSYSVGERGAYTIKISEN